MSYLDQKTSIQIAGSSTKVIISYPTELADELIDRIFILDYENKIVEFEPESLVLDDLTVIHKDITSERPIGILAGYEGSTTLKICGDASFFSGSKVVSVDSGCFRHFILDV